MTRDSSLATAPATGRRDRRRARWRRSRRPSGSASTRCGRPRPTAPTPSRRSPGGAPTPSASASAPASSSCPPARRRPRRWRRSRSTTSPAGGSSSASARPARRSSRAGTASRTPARSPAPASTSTIVRRIVARGEPVEHHGEFYDLPLQGGTGLGKALKSTVHPLRTDIPIFIAAEGPKNVALAAEIGDGWLPLFFAPKEDAFYRECLAEGFAASGEAGKADRFEVASSVIDRPRRRRRALRRRRPPVPRPLRRRDGRPRRQLPLRGLRPDGLRGRRHEGPGAVPRRAQGRGRGGDPAGDGRGRRPRRPAGEDPRRAGRAGGTRASPRSSSAARRRRSRATPSCSPADASTVRRGPRTRRRSCRR